MSRTFLFNVIAVSIFAIGVFLFFQYVQPQTSTIAMPPQKTQLSAVAISQSTSTATANSPTKVSATTSPVKTVVPTVQSPTKSTAQASISTSTTASDEIARIQNPYSTASESWGDINTQARDAIVNVLCEPTGTSSLDPISGSGVIIDPRGIILTNAHVAQYVLLSEDPQVDLHCTIRTGSPAEATWTAAVLYIPPIWVSQHVGEILDQHPTGTGQYDYALLYITGSTDQSSLPAQFPYLSPDVRPAIGFPGDNVLVASYPAEFVGGIVAEYDLYADTSVTPIQQLLTFTTSTPDVLSLGGVIEAQSGSSGGAVVNAWGRLIGIVTTTSSGTTTADRDLRAIALSYINSDIDAQSGANLTTILAGDPATEVQLFDQATAPSLLKLYIAQLTPQQAAQ